MDTKKETADGSAKTQKSFRFDLFSIDRCSLTDLILKEQLMLEGVAEILEEFGCSPDGGEKADDQIEVSAVALWTLGQVVAESREKIVSTLENVGEQYRALGVDKFLKDRRGPCRKKNVELSAAD